MEKRTTAKLQDDRTVRKIVLLDDHVGVAFAGMYFFLVMLYICVCVCVCLLYYV